jgi:glucosyl-3-phosphoglycerate synthase
MTARFTFAVVGHDEEASLPYALGMARRAAGDEDTVLFVDSASTDRSAEIARSLGVEVVAAPLGKGRAMQVAFDRCRDDFLCFVDADYGESEHNIPERLRETAAAGTHDMVVGAFVEPARRRTLTPGLYLPLVRRLFPELVTEAELVPLSGFRVVRVGFPFGRFPAGYGVEAHLNINAVQAGGTVGVCPVGVFRGDLRNYTNVVEVGRDMTTTILDLAVVHHRIDAADRPAWDAWVDVVLDAIAAQPPIGEDATEFLAHLGTLAARPFPGSADHHPPVAPAGVRPGL